MWVLKGFDFSHEKLNPFLQFEREADHDLAYCFLGRHNCGDYRIHDLIFFASIVNF